MIDISVFICPRTGTPLRSKGDGLFNDRGELVAQTRGRLVCFDTSSQAESGSDLACLQYLCTLAREQDWRSALAACYEPEFVEYVADTSRQRFIELLPLSPEADVLEIGPGLGQFTGALASRSQFVDALEVVPRQAEFAALRLQQEGVKNVRVAAGGGDCRLPYRDGAFDGVVLNLVFEWCAARSNEEHAAVQQRFLNEMFRVLRPGGFLYLATKNRFGISYVCGKPDEHFDGMRFGSALPRALARALFGRRQPGMLHSYSTLRQKIESTGFVVTKSWWAAPDYRNPVALVETDASSVAEARLSNGFVSGRSRLERFALRTMPASWVKHFMPGLNFLAFKSTPQS